jgi:hypothetical protein
MTSLRLGTGISRPLSVFCVTGFRGDVRVMVIRLAPSGMIPTGKAKAPRRGPALY